MSLQRRTILVTLVCVLLSMAGIYLAAQLTLLKSFETIENDDTRAVVLRVAESFFNDARRIVPSARGYAVWDDMYAYVQKPDPAFLDYIALTPDIFATHNVNLIAILDQDYNVLFLKLFDLNTLHPLDEPRDLRGLLTRGSPLLDHRYKGPEIDGLILLEGRPMFVASLASLKTDFSGEPRGAVIFGRYIDEETSANLSRLTGQAVSVHSLEESGQPENIRHAINTLKTALAVYSVYVEIVDEKTISGYIILKSITAEPAFLLRVDMPRAIHAQSLRSLRYFILSILVLGIVMLTVFVLLLRHDVLAPLSSLHRQIHAIQASEDNALRLNVSGKNELADLGHALNRMLASLEKHAVQLEASNQDLEAFSYSVSHDLRAPLRSIVSFSAILLEEHSAGLTPEGMHYLERINANATRMSALIDSLLQLSHLGHTTFSPVSVDLNTLVKGVLDEYGEEIGERRVAVELRPLSPCQGSPDLLKQVYANLIGNALKYSRNIPAARIEIGETVEADRVVYFVADNGAGFDMRYAGNLFKVFQRLHSEREFSGLGVGLSIVKRIVNLHGGRVWAEGQPGQGATFFFTLG